jgi:hypothetical protein
MEPIPPPDSRFENPRLFWIEKSDKLGKTGLGDGDCRNEW